MKNQWIRPSLCMLLVLLFAACPGPTPEKPATPAATAAAPMTVEQTEAARQALVEWFECEECEESQLENVAKLGENAVPSLRAALLEGASPASEELLRGDLEKRYDELRTYASTHPETKLPSSKEEFVAIYTSNLNAQYKTRAAQALGRIGGANAVRALEEGMKRADRPDVQASVKNALATVNR